MGCSQTDRPEGPHPLDSRGIPPEASSGITVTFAKRALRLSTLFLCPGHITHSLLTRPPLYDLLLHHTVRLACLSHAASVRSEPGSNSSKKFANASPRFRGAANHRLLGSNKSSAKRECLSDRPRGAADRQSTPISTQGVKPLRVIGDHRPPSRLAASRGPHILAFDLCSLVKELGKPLAVSY